MQYPCYFIILLPLYLRGTLVFRKCPGRCEQLWKKWICQTIFLRADTKKLQKLCLNLYQGAYRFQRIKSRINLFLLLNTFFRCSSNVNLTSKITPRCVWKLTWETLLLLKSKGGCVAFFNFLLNMISWACLLRSGLKVIFH